MCSNSFIRASSRYCSEDSFLFSPRRSSEVIDTSLKLITFAARTFCLLRCFIAELLPRVNRAKQIKRVSLLYELKAAPRPRSALPFS